MAEEENDLDLEDETSGTETAPEPAPQAQQDANYWRVRAEKAERKAKRTDAYLAIRDKFPGVSMDDLKGVDVAHWERIASRLAAPASPAEPGGDTAPETPTTAPSSEAIEAAKTFTAGAGGSGPAATEKISFEEAERLGGLANPQIYEMARKGLVEGVKASS